MICENMNKKKQVKWKIWIKVKLYLLYPDSFSVRAFLQAKEIGEKMGC